MGSGPTTGEQAAGRLFKRQLNKVYVWYTGGFLAFVIALYTYPLIYVFTKSALDLVSTELEDAASIHGAGKFQTMARVTLPLVPSMKVPAAAAIGFLASP